MSNVASIKHRPGEIRDAIVDVLTASGGEPLPVKDIEAQVAERISSVASSSVRSYLRLNTPELFERPKRAHYRLREQLTLEYGEVRSADELQVFRYGDATLFQDDCFAWLRSAESDSVHAVVTDPPYGLVEYSSHQQRKLREGRGGVWRIPPSFDGAKRSPLPRFTVLRQDDLRALDAFFLNWGRLLLPVLVPGATVLVASNPLLSYLVSGALAKAGLERRGELIRLVMTMRGGDRPKAAHQEFSEVSVMPRSMWEPWLVFRKPIEGRVQDNLRKWGTGGFRRVSAGKPFGDVIQSRPTRKSEKTLAPHPSLKPQEFLRHVVRAVLPLGHGAVLDPFAGSGSTLAAAEAVGYRSIGVERDPHFFEIACAGMPLLADLKVGTS